MPRTSRALSVSRLSLLAAILLLSRTAVAQTVWSSLTKSFSKASFSDDTLPENQDPLTANVVLTRGSSGGLINIAAEVFYDSSTSPSLTQWATDLNNPTQTIAATNWQNLAFTDWLDAYGGSGSGGSLIAGRTAVVYLTSDDVYLDLQFTSWSPGHGGSYSYLRAVPPASSPTGDYNNNGIVDAADYVVWRKNDGTSNLLPNDPIGGTIGGAQYNQWRAHFGQPQSSGAGAMASATVPEPATLQLLTFAIAGWFLRRRRNA